MNHWNDLNWWGSEEEECTEENAMGWAGASVLPHRNYWYRALELTPFDKVKCVILGQDPYHTPGVANGLAFSTDPTVVSLPPSLRNVFKEYQSDLSLPAPRNGDLTQWAERGVLLLNTSLTVEPHKPASHSNIGWDVFTKEVISSLNEYKRHVVFLLWGRHAQNYAPLISVKRNFIIRSPHPSPYSANTGFFGSKPFTRTNNYLRSKRQEPIQWRLT